MPLLWVATIMLLARKSADAGTSAMRILLPGGALRAIPAATVSGDAPPPVAQATSRQAVRVVGRIWRMCFSWLFG